jgi:hypothetical protein
VDGNDSITQQSRSSAVWRAPAFALRWRVTLNEELDWFRHDPRWFVRAAANYSRFSWDQGRSFRDQGRDLTSPRARLLHAATAPLGWMLHRRDRAAAAA